MIKEIKEDENYSIERIIQEKLLTRWDNQSASYWQIRDLFKKGILKNYNRFGKQRNRWFTKGKDLIEFLKENE